MADYAQQPALSVAGDSLASPQAILAEGFAHHRAKRLDEAEHCYRKVLELVPEHAESLHHLGLVLHQRGQSEQGLELIRQALTRNPQSPNIHFNLSTILRHLGRT
ncbi:MAG TPA: tetratricopeptide repeat protein, partial [bacterium]